MKKVVFFLTLFSIILVPLQNEASTAVGVIVGEPTGISLKFGNFPVIGIAWSLDDYFHFHCDYWVKNPHLKNSLDWYWGAGVKITGSKKPGDDRIVLGFRLPLGIQYFFSKRWEIFVEIAPGMLIIPKTDFDFDGGIGVRYHFK